MSLDTWKAEFYPVGADEVGKEEALNHSIRKWEGLTYANLSKHGVIKKNKLIASSIEGLTGEINAPLLIVDGVSCALCCQYPTCYGCPLFISLGEMTCDEERSSPYNIWLSTGDAEPMIEALKTARGDND